ncbi:MAG: IpaD/SipD/SspD family type III secretion system needle tip protein [Symbiopectobacterium sp.]
MNVLIFSAIGKMSEIYFDVFQQAVEKNAQFYKDFSDFISKLPEFISEDGDKSILDGKGFKKAFKSLWINIIFQVYQRHYFQLKRGPTVQSASREECEAWAKEFGLSSNDGIYQLPDGSLYIIHIDIS